jgi:hypothetical protein
LHESVISTDAVGHSLSGAVGFCQALIHATLPRLLLDFGALGGPGSLLSPLAAERSREQHASRDEWVEAGAKSSRSQPDNVLAPVLLSRSSDGSRVVLAYRPLSEPSRYVVELLRRVVTVEEVDGNRTTLLFTDVEEMTLDMEEGETLRAKREAVKERFTIVMGREVAVATLVS